MKLVEALPTYGIHYYGVKVSEYWKTKLSELFYAFFLIKAAHLVKTSKEMLSCRSAPFKDFLPFWLSSSYLSQIMKKFGVLFILQSLQKQRSLLIQLFVIWLPWIHLEHFD